MDDEIPLHGGSHASSSHEDSLEQTTKRREDLGKHSVHTHFFKDRNCEICQRDKNYCSRGAGLGHSMDPSVSVQNKNFIGNQRSLQKFLEPDRKPKVIYTTIPWNSAKLVKIFHGIIARLHHTDRRLMVLWKEQCAE